MEKLYPQFEREAERSTHREKPSFLVQHDADAVLLAIKPDRETAIMIQRGEIDLIEDGCVSDVKELGDERNEVGATRETINNGLKNLFPKRADDLFRFIEVK